MKNEPESRKEEAMQDVHNWLSSVIESEKEFIKQRTYKAKLIVPDNIESFFTIQYTDENDLINYESYNQYIKCYIGKIYLGSFKYDEALSEEYISGALANLRKGISSVLKDYRMLKPGAVSLEKKNNKVYLRCIIKYSRNGMEKTIFAETLAELSARMELELDLLMNGSELLLMYKEKITNPMLIDYMLSENKIKSYLRSCKLFHLLLFGNTDEQAYARSEICTLLERNKEMFEEEFNKAEIRKQLELFAGSDENNNVEYFYEKLENAIGNNKKYISARKLAESIDCSYAQLSRIRQRISKPSKELALRLGMALGFTKDKMKEFIESLGYIFPYDKRDMLIIKCIEDNIVDYSRIQEMLSAHDYDIVFKP